VEERRSPVRQFARALIGAFGALAAIGGAALACELPPGERVESERIALSYRTIPAQIAVGQPFVLELAACPKRGAAVAERVKLDAHMPEHRHGMNYRTKVTPLGAGRFHSEGWLFHMPGRWEFVFEVDSERFTDSVRLE